MNSAARTYTSASIQEAIRKIKEDIGREAVILSTRRIPASERRHRDDIFQVTAVADTPAPTAAEPWAPATAYAQQDWPEERQPTSPNAPLASDESTTPPGLQKELADIKSALFLLSRPQGVSPLLAQHPEFMNVYAKLIKSGISQPRAWRLIEKGAADLAEAQGQQRGALEATLVNRHVIRQISRTVPIARPFAELSPDKRHLAAFIGPTGSGKTTTIAKLAAELSFNQKKAVGLISIDNYRIGALEQLKTYAAIMGLPCLPAFNQADLRKAVGKMADRQIILIDTAGQSHLDQQRMQELEQAVGGDLPVARHLVVSATTGQNDLKDITRSFSCLAPETFIFSKIDETRQPGSLIDQAADARLPVSYFTNGQRVPEDIQTASKKRVLSLIFRHTV